MLVDGVCMDGDTDFKAQLESRIRRFAAQRDELRNQLVEFNHTLNDIEKRLETAAEMYRLEFKADPPVVGAGQAGARRTLREGGESWNEAVEAVLTEASEPLHITEIWDRVQQRGFTTTAKDPLRAIASILVRHPGAHRTSPNTYTLAPSNGAALISGVQQSLVSVPSTETGATSPGGET